MKKLLLILSVMLLTGCSMSKIYNKDIDINKMKAPEATHFYDDGKAVIINNLRTGRDFENQEFKKPPERIVCVWQNSIETPIALGVGERIVAGMGVHNARYIKEEYREQYEKIPITSLENLDQESVIMMQPDMIIGWYSTFTSKYLRSTDFWHRRGVGTYIAVSSAWLPNGQILENEYNDILNLGKVFNKRKEAEAIVNAMKKEIANVTEQTKGLKQPRALIMGGMGRQIGVYGKNSLAGDLVRRLNGELLAANERNISVEQVIEMDPDVIFYLVGENRYKDMGKIIEDVYKINGLKNISCVRNRRIVALPLNAIYTPGVRTIDGIKIIAHGLYPQLYAKPDSF